MRSGRLLASCPWPTLGRWPAGSWLGPGRSCRNSPTAAPAIPVAAPAPAPGRPPGRVSGTSRKSFTSRVPGRDVAIEPPPGVFPTDGVFPGEGGLPTAGPVPAIEGRVSAGRAAGAVGRLTQGVELTDGRE